MRYPASKAVREADAQYYVASLTGGEIAVAVREVAALGLNAGGKFSVFVGRKD